MTINLEGITNKPYSMVMSGTFLWPDGTELAISSDHTSLYLSELDDEELKELQQDENFGIFDPDSVCKFNMSWELCYIYDPNCEDDEILYYLTKKDVPLFNEAKLSEFFLHEDAPNDYFVKFTSFHPE